MTPEQMLSLGLDPIVVRALAPKKKKEKKQPPPAEAVPSPLPPTAEGDAPSLPELTPEEREAMISKVGRSALGGLQWIGESLDKPGRALRGILAGEPSELLDIIPFSDTLGLTTPEDDVSGRDLAEKYGLLSENQAGLDLGDVAGFGVEVVLDPMAWLTLGGSTVAKNTIKSAGVAEKALTAAGKSKEIAEGIRPLVQLHTPSLGIPLPDRIPFTKIKIPKPPEIPVKVLAEWTGPQAAAVYDAINFGKYSPNPWIRKGFSHAEEVQAAPVSGQKKALQLFEDRTNLMDAATERAIEFGRKETTAVKAVAKLTAKTFADPKLDMLSAIETFYNGSNEVKRMVHSKFGDNVDWKAIQSDPKALDHAAELYDKITAGRAEFKELANDLEVRFEELRAAHLGELANTDASHARWFDDTIRQFVEAKGTPVSMDTVVTRMKESGFNEGVSGFDEAAQAMYDLNDQLVRMYKTELSEAKKLGIDLDALNDYYVGYSHRRPDFEIGSPMANYLKKKMISGRAPFMIARDDVLRNIPGGTKTINDMTRDPRFTAVKFQRAVADAIYGQRGDLDGSGWAAKPQPHEYSYPAYEAARESGASWPTVKAITQEINALEMERLRQLKTDKRHLFSIVSGILGPEWRKSVDAISKADGDYTQLVGFDEVMEALRRGESDHFLKQASDIDEHEVWSRLVNWKDPAGIKKSPQDIAREAMERYEILRKEDPDGDLFNLTNDPTSFPDPSLDGRGPKYTFDNAAYLLASEYNLPAWWRFDELIRNKLKESPDEAIAAIANNGELSEHQFKDALWNHYKQQQAGLPEDSRWAEQMTDNDDFITTLKKLTPALDEIPIMHQSDLHDLVRRLYHMPKQVLDEGLFNRSTTDDAMDYLLQMTKVKAGISTMRRMLKEKGGMSDAADFSGTPLREVWKKMQLTDEGLEDFVREAKGQPDLAGDALESAIDGLKVDGDLADMAARYVEMFKDLPENQSWLGRGLDQINSLFKSKLTLPYPAFHVRNRIGGLAANWVAGIHSSEADDYAKKLFLGKINPDEADQWLSELKNYDVYSVGTGGGSNQVYDRLEQYRGVSDSRLPTEGGLARYIVGPFGEFASDTAETYRASGLRSAIRQIATGGVTPSGKTATDYNYFGVSGGFDPFSYKRRAGETNAFGQPLSKMERMTSDKTTNVVMQAGTRANDYVEWMNRVGPYIALRKAGWSPALAARKVKQVQFNYKELSPLEKKYMRRLVPFYSFMRKNLEQQVRLLLANPGGRTAQTVRAENNANREGRSKGSYVPKYLAESFSVRLPGGDDNNAKFYSQSGLLPAEEAFNRFVFDDRGIPISGKRTAEKFLAQASPLIQGPLEQLTGRQFWSGRKLDDLFQTPTSDQDVNLFLSKMPTTRFVNTVGGLLDDRKPIPLRAFNTLVGGAKVTDVNVAKQRALELRDILEKNLVADPDIDEFTQLYAKDLQSLVNRANSGDDEAAKMLRFYLDLKNELKSIKRAEKSQTSEQ